MISSGVHGALLLAALVVFSDTQKFTDAQETIPVEIISESDLSQIMKGEKTAKEQKPAPPRAEKVAEIAEPTPKPVIQESKVDVPTPPPPLRRLPDPGEDETPPAPLPPQRVAALPPPPPTPEPVKPDPPKPTPRPVEPQKVEAKPEPPKPPDAEAIEPPKPPVRPKIEPPKKAEAPAPEPPKRAPTPPKPDPKPEAKPDQKLQPDKIASLLNERKREEKPPSRPKSGDENAEPQRRLNPGEISRLLTREDPGQRAATGRELNRTASLGAPNANAAKMSPAMWDQFLGFLKDKYDSCWDSKPPNSEGLGYRPKINIRFARNGTLELAPRLLNPPTDPARRALADSAIRAVNHPDCNPMRIPARFDAFYEQWKEMPLVFDPSD